MPLTVGSRLGVYEITAKIGAGGMGEVYRARDTKLNRDVALKVLSAGFTADPERLARFQREAQVLASLNHPNVGAIYGLEDAGNSPALVLEMVEGPTLADRIAEGPMPPVEALPIARQIAEAIEYAHEHGVVHRDLKPANIKLDAEGRAKVLDFGLAKAIAGDSATSRSDPSFSPTITSLGTMAGVMIGTAAYMAPEQARAAAVDRRADIWAFGAVLFEMLTGRRAFEGDTVSDTLAAVLRAPVAWELLPARIPRNVVRLLERCLERDPKKRLRDIGEARIVLENPADDPKDAADVAGIVAGTAAAPRSRFLSLLPWALAALSVAGLVTIIVLSRRTEAPARVVRFEIAAIDALSYMTWPRISPDGRTLAFLGRGSSGPPSVWIRPLDAVEPYPLNGTEGAGRPFWSPDSRYVAYFKEGQLLRVPLAGGPSQLICQAASGADGSWGAAGVILFDGRTNDPIRRCNASGGPVADQPGPDAAAGETQHGWPMFLPDGKHYLFLVSGSGGEQVIHVASLDETGSKALVSADSRVEYGNGHLVYLLQNTLVAQAFDEGRLETVGDPVPLASGIANERQPGFSVSSNGVLTYLTGGGSGSGRLVWVDRSGRDVETVGPPGEYRDLALSPDETRLAYGFADGSGQNEDIWIRDLKRGVTTRLTSDPKWDAAPVWSPDGARIVYSAERAGAPELMTKSSAATGAEESLHAVPGMRVSPMSWSRDGRFVTLTRFAPGVPPDIDILTLDGKPAASTFVGEAGVGESGARFSPDGKWIAYHSDETGRAEVYVQSYPQTGAKWTISSGGGRVAQWRADGRELFFENLEDTIFAVPVTAGATFEVGISKALFTRPMQRSGSVRNRWVVSADGARFLVNEAPERRATSTFSVVLNWPEGL